MLLTGLARCGTQGCGLGLTIRTAKNGRYAYYTCNAKAIAGAVQCSGKSVRQDELDRIVVQLLLDRVLAPERLKALLAKVLERSEEADERRKADLDRVRRERKAADNGRRRLWQLVDEGLERSADPVFAALLAERREAAAALESSERVLVAQLAAGKRRIDEAAVERFGTMMRERIARGDPAFRKAYVRLFVSDIKVSDTQIAVSGTRVALEAALVHGERTGIPKVPSFDREWCACRTQRHYAGY